MRLVTTRFLLDDGLAVDAETDLDTDRWRAPAFSLAGARALAAATQALAERIGHECMQTVHVLGDDDDTDPRDHDFDQDEDAPALKAIVLVITWDHMADGPKAATRIVTPDPTGRYWIGGDWPWEVATWQCACGLRDEWHNTTCDNCGRTRDDQARPAGASA
ncbi:hypothetical protein [Kitasatospora sp. NPDC058046]|uniref:hypothetical protein n=1 Tax=Kitasatospora sp. NPDC058046 TaxID=3346312 RepID=UPI0036D98109